jgi:hypothetical protein
MQHRIRVTGDRVSGAVTLTSDEPIIAAARALIESGASPSDILRVDTGGDVTIAPMSLHSFAAPRQRTLKSESDYRFHLARQG